MKKRISATAIKEADVSTVPPQGQEGADLDRVTIDDFDNAVKQEWSVHTCIVSQFGLRRGLKHGEDNRSAIGTLLAKKCRELGEIQWTFDTNFRKPGDEKKPELQALRASLPITITLP